MDYAKKDKNTLVVVTADHETGGFHILGGRISKENSYIKGDFLTTGHSGDMVPIFSYGPYSENFSGIYDNTEIFKKLNKTSRNHLSADCKRSRITLKLTI